MEHMDHRIETSSNWLMPEAIREESRKGDGSANERKATKMRNGLLLFRKLPGNASTRWASTR